MRSCNKTYHGVPCSRAMSAIYSTIQEAWHLAPVSDESVIFWELLLDMYTLRVEKKLLLSLLSIKTSLGRKEGCSDHHNSWTKCFQQKPHNKNLEYTIMNPMTPCFWCINEVCNRFCGYRQTHRQNDYSNPTVHTPRNNNYAAGRGFVYLFSAAVAATTIAALGQ